MVQIEGSKKQFFNNEPNSSKRSGLFLADPCEPSTWDWAKKNEVAIGHSGSEMALYDKKGLKMPKNGPKIGCWARPIQPTQEIVETSYDA